MARVYTIDAEELAYWYFRLNGCLTIKDFVLHPDWGIGQLTDIDIVAVRFPHRQELLRNPMRDDRKLFANRTRIRVILAEVKAGMCRLNLSWTKRQKRNMQRALRAIGAFPGDVTEHVADCLYGVGFYRDSQFHISFCCLGSHENPEITKKYPEVPQLPWDDVLAFIHRRFVEFRKQKREHRQWDRVGRSLWDLAMKYPDFGDFRAAIQVVQR